MAIELLSVYLILPMDDRQAKLFNWQYTDKQVLSIIYYV